MPGVAFPMATAWGIDAVSALFATALAAAFGHLAWRLRTPSYALVALARGQARPSIGSFDVKAAEAWAAA